MKPKFDKESYRIGYENGYKAAKFHFENRSKTGNPLSRKIPNLHVYMRRMERLYVLLALRRANGSKQKASQMLGISRTTLVEKIKRLKREQGNPVLKLRITHFNHETRGIYCGDDPKFSTSNPSKVTCKKCKEEIRYSLENSWQTRLTLS